MPAQDVTEEMETSYRVGPDVRQPSLEAGGEEPAAVTSQELLGLIQILTRRWEKVKKASEASPEPQKH